MRNFYRDVFSISEHRLLVITGHLYLDYILEKMLEKANLELSEKQKQSFHIKVDKLNKSNMFDSETLISLIEINRLRNLLAHNIFYEISDWDPNRLPYAAKFNIKIPKRKYLLKAFNITYLRVSFFALIVVLSNQHKWLYLEDNPRRLR